MFHESYHEVYRPLNREQTPKQDDCCIYVCSLAVLFSLYHCIYIQNSSHGDVTYNTSLPPYRMQSSLCLAIYLYNFAAAFIKVFSLHLTRFAPVTRHCSVHSTIHMTNLL